MRSTAVTTADRACPRDRTARVRIPLAFAKMCYNRNGRSLTLSSSQRSILRGVMRPLSLLDSRAGTALLLAMAAFALPVAARAQVVHHDFEDGYHSGPGSARHRDPGRHERGRRHRPPQPQDHGTNGAVEHSVTSARPPSRPPRGGCRGTGRAAVISVATVPVGALLGFALSPGEKWETVTPGRLRIAVMPVHGGGLHAAVSVHF
jgi:hypothetical protein